MELSLLVNSEGSRIEQLRVNRNVNAVANLAVCSVKLKQWLDVDASNATNAKAYGQIAVNSVLCTGCYCWKDRVNMEDTLFAGAVIDRIGAHYDINCDSSQIAETLYLEAKDDLYGFMQTKNASHFRRLTGFGLEKDIRYCLTPDNANVLVIYEAGKLIVG